MADLWSLPAEVILMIFERLEDISSFTNLVEADGSMLIPLVSSQWNMLLPKVFQKRWSEELCQYAYMILLVEDQTP